MGMEEEVAMTGKSNAATHDTREEEGGDAASFESCDKQLTGNKI